MYPAKEEIFDVNVKAIAHADEIKERSEHVRKCDHLNYFIESFICNLEQATEVPYSLRAVNLAYMNTLEESIRVSGFETRCGVFTLTLCVDCAVSKDPFAVERGIKFLNDVVNVSLVDGRHRFAALSGLRATGTPCFGGKEAVRCL